MPSGMRVRARVRGERTVRRNLERLAQVLDGKEMATALLAGARVYAKKMRDLAPKRTGKLQNSIYAFNAYESDYSSGRRLRIRLKNNEAMAVASSPIAVIVEFGTKPHRIRPRKRKALAFDGAIVGGVEKQAARAHPFWRPATYQGANEATRAVGLAVDVIVEKFD